MAIIEKVLTIKEAAEALGVSADTVRRRIKTGELKAEKVQGAYGMQWAIRPDDLAHSMQVVDMVPVKQSLSADDLEAMFKRLMQEQTNEIKALRAEVQQLREQLQDQKLLTANNEKRWWQVWKK